MSSYSQYKVKLYDFGSSCCTPNPFSFYIQSCNYHAPEAILGLPYDGCIDLWSLSCILAKLYSGRVLFQNDSSSPCWPASWLSGDVPPITCCARNRTSHATVPTPDCSTKKST
mmetsp:Transcript_28610/g.65401  ORF Transcript_28610/g.65401 Transcript_28610/m.65401 type:complete len:113 (+) Transcript_28610:508-846(+)